MEGGEPEIWIVELRPRSVSMTGSEQGEEIIGEEEGYSEQRGPRVCGLWRGEGGSEDII